MRYDNMENTKIDVNDYIEYGLGDIYYGLISFISKYATANYNPLEILENGESNYTIAITTMKEALKELLDYFKTNDTVFLPSLNREVNIKYLNIKEQLALEEKCKEYLIAKLNEELNSNLKKQTSPKSK